jgi:hypothetical protein
MAECLDELVRAAAAPPRHDGGERVATGSNGLLELPKLYWLLVRENPKDALGERLWAAFRFDLLFNERKRSTRRASVLRTSMGTMPFGANGGRQSYADPPRKMTRPSGRFNSARFARIGTLQRVVKSAGRTELAQDFTSIAAAQRKWIDIDKSVMEAVVTSEDYGADVIADARSNNVEAIRSRTDWHRNASGVLRAGGKKPTSAAKKTPFRSACGASTFRASLGQGDRFFDSFFCSPRNAGLSRPIDSQHTVFLRHLREVNRIFRCECGYTLNQPDHDISPSLRASGVPWRKRNAAKAADEKLGVRIDQHLLPRVFVHGVLLANSRTAERT